MQHRIQLSATEIESRLRKIEDSALNIFCDEVREEIIDGFSCISVSINHQPDKLELNFRSPVAVTNTATTKLCVRQTGTDDYKIFAFADANGNDVGEINNLFATNAIVKVILDLGSSLPGVDGVAFVQNADTNAYLESKFQQFEAIDRALDSILAVQEEFLAAQN